MNQEVLEQPLVLASERRDTPLATLGSFLPAVIAVGGSLLLVAGRISFGGDRFISDSALMMLGLASYLIAAVFYLTNFYAPFRLAERLGLWAATLGVFLQSVELARQMGCGVRSRARYIYRPGTQCCGYAVGISLCPVRESV